MVKICPNCRSSDIEHNMNALTIGIGSFQDSYKCNNCGYEGNVIEMEKTKINKKSLKKKK